MNLRDLQYLITLSELGHVGQAAKACHVSQPTLSMQLKKLEGTLGIALFERAHKSLRLTQAGEQIVAQARRVVGEANALQTLAQTLHDPLAGDFRLGAFPTLAPYYLPRAVPKLSEALPNVRLYLIEDKSARLIEQMEQGALDAALLALPAGGHGLQETFLFEEPFYLAVARSHPLAGVASVSPDILATQRLLLLEDGHCMRTQALEICQKIGSGVEQEGFSATSLETLRQMVGSGLGVTLIPECALTPSADILYIPFEGRPFVRRIGLVWRATHPRKKLLEALVARLRRL
jgi:LysR family hydrogen peroxide-inducible transcriptional activator